MVLQTTRWLCMQMQMNVLFSRKREYDYFRGVDLSPINKRKSIVENRNAALLITPTK